MAHDIQDVAVEAQGNIYWLWLDFPQPLKSYRSPAKAREIDEGLRGEAMAVAITTCFKVHASSRTLRGSRLGREGLKEARQLSGVKRRTCSRMSPNWQRHIGLLQIGFAGAIGSNGVEGLLRRLKACRRREHAATCIAKKLA